MSQVEIEYIIHFAFETTANVCSYLLPFHAITIQQRSKSH